MRFPTLSVEETEALIARAQAGDIEARNRVIEANQGLIWHYISHHQRPLHSMDADDLAQAAIFGVIKAIQMYRPTAGKFSTYAMVWIRQAIHRAIVNEDAMIRLPVHVDNHYIRALQRQNLHQAMDEEEQRAYTYGMQTRHIRSLDRTIDADGEERWGDLQAAPALILPSRSEAQWQQVFVDCGLSEREIDIGMRLTFGGETLEEVGQRYQLSRERIRQIWLEARRRLARHPEIRQLWYEQMA